MEKYAKRSRQKFKLSNQHVKSIVFISIQTRQDNGEGGGWGLLFIAYCAVLLPYL